MTLTDARPTRGPIQVRDGDRILAHAVPACAGEQWACWQYGGNGPTDWTHIIVADSDAALAKLREWYPAVT